MRRGRRPRRSTAGASAYDPLARTVSKGKLCGQHCGFNLHAATRVAANDKAGRASLCRYILRPPLANDRLVMLPEGSVQLSFCPGTLGGFQTSRDGTSAAEPPTSLRNTSAPGRTAPARSRSRPWPSSPGWRPSCPLPGASHVTRYFGVLSSHSKLRSQVVPAQPAPAELPAHDGDAAKPPGGSRYIPWAELLRRTWGIDVLECHTCRGRLRLIALVKTETTIKKILGGMGLPTEPPQPIPPVHRRPHARTPLVARTG
jgi:hypothetical protein